MTCPGAHQWISRRLSHDADQDLDPSTGKAAREGAAHAPSRASVRSIVNNHSASASAENLLERVFPKRVADRLLAGLKVCGSAVTGVRVAQAKCMLYDGRSKFAADRSSSSAAGTCGRVRNCNSPDYGTLRCDSCVRCGSSSLGALRHVGARF